MGGKNSGRYKAGTKKNKIKTKTAEAVQAPKVETVQMPAIELEETMDFEANAARILKESQAQIESEKVKEEPKASPEKEGVEPQPEPVKPKKEDWSPVVAFFMNVAGQIFESQTGFKEMNYSEDEIEQCSEAGSEIINVLWPDVKALTEEQKILILNSMVILKVHVAKISLLKELKEAKKTVEVQNEATAKATTQSAA